MANSTFTYNTEIRKLKPAHRCALSDILNVSDSWKKLMAIIPRNDANTMRFNSEHVSIVEQMARKYRHNAAEILLDEWGTMGRERPTLQVLLDLLIKAELFRAADYVASEILNVDLPQRPEYGPAAVVDISDETLAKLISQQAKLENNDYSKSISFIGSSCDVNVGEIKYVPDAIDLMDPCVLKNSLHADEPNKVILNHMEADLIKFSTNKLPNKEMAPNNTVPDEALLKSTTKNLIKFSTNEISYAGITENLKIETKKESELQNVLTNEPSSTDCKYQEMSSQELPAFFNNLEQSKNGSNELKSSELPAFLNQSSFILHESVTSSNNNSTSTVDVSNSSNSSDCYSNLRSINHESSSMNYPLQTEIASCSLPKYAADREEDSSELHKINNSNENTPVSDYLPLTVLEYNK